jgi:hypothetical protein
MECHIQQQRADHPTLWHTGFCGMPHRALHVPSFEPLFDQPPRWEVAKGLQLGRVPDVIEGPFNIGIYDPRPLGIRSSQVEEFLDRIVTSPAGAKPLTHPLKRCFPERFQGVFHHGLDASMNDDGNAQQSFAFSLRNIDPPNRLNPVQGQLTDMNSG